MAGPTIEFWQERFETGTTPWDRGGPSPQLMAWLADVMRPAIDSGMTVLVPGCGSGWDVAALAAFGAIVTGIDYAPAAIERTRALLSERGLDADVVQADVLQWSPPRPVDTIFEQTCLCALHPDDWIRYGERLHAWLRPGGRQLAMFMQKLRPGAAEGFVEGPPYHCDIHAMRALLPSTRWNWPTPPYVQTPHPIGAIELGVVIVRR